MYGRNIYADHRVFINNVEILGVIDFNGVLEVPTEYVRVLGTSYGAPERSGPDVKNISITKHLSPNEPLRYFTGIQPCNGMIIYNNKNFAFENAYLTNYSMSCAIGEIAVTQADFEIYGRIGGNFEPTPQNLPQQSVNLDVSHFGNINLQTSEGNTNRIVSFDISIDCKRVPQYILGSPYPGEVYLNKPLEIELIIGVDVDDYECNNIQTILCNSKKNIFLELKNCDNTSTMESFLLPNAQLTAENISASLDNSARVELTYKSYIH
jgi:hypothetical protein